MLQMVEKLVNKISLIMGNNTQRYQLYGIGGSPRGEKLTSQIRHTDPGTALAVLKGVYEPARQKIISDSRDILTDLLSLRRRMIKDAFTDHAPSIDSY